MRRRIIAAMIALVMVFSLTGCLSAVSFEAIGLLSEGRDDLSDFIDGIFERAAKYCDADELVLIKEAFALGLESGLGWEGGKPRSRPLAPEGYAAQVEAPEPAASAEWTLLIYLCGSDLESRYAEASGTLEELMNADAAGSPVNVAVQTGGAEQWHNDLVNGDMLQRFQLRDGAYSLVWEGGRQSMGRADTLGDFIAWGAEAFPAERYMLVLWDHGGGSSAGAVFDETYGDDAIELHELKEALELGGVNFELLGIDACCMASIETAAAVMDRAGYLVASQEYEPGGGWDYEAIIEHLSADAQSDGLALGRAVCDSYYMKSSRIGEGGMATLSVVDLSAADELLASFEVMARELLEAGEDPAALAAIDRAAESAERYGAGTDEEGYTNMIDLAGLVMNARSLLPDSADAVLRDILDAVVYDVHGNSRAGSNGISVFYPIDADPEECGRYELASPSAAYTRFVDAAVPEWEAKGEQE